MRCGAIELKPGSATVPFFGVQPALVDNREKFWTAKPRESGDPRLLAGQARTLFGDHERFEQTYFSAFKGMYFAGTVPAVMKTAITGSPGGWMMC